MNNLYDPRVFDLQSTSDQLGDRVESLEEC